MELLATETEELGENLPQCRFVHHKPHMSARTRTRAAAVGSQRLTAELRHGLFSNVTRFPYCEGGCKYRFCILRY
jgi:hypothetical protein